MIKSQSRFQIVSADIADCPLLSALAMRSKAHWGYSEEFMAACEAELRITPERIMSSNHLIYYAHSEVDGVLGFYDLLLNHNKPSELEALFVEPKFIGMGVGKALFEHLTAQLLKLSPANATLLIHSDPQAKVFYQSQNCQYIGEVPSGSISKRTLPLMHWQPEHDPVNEIS